MSYPSSSNCQPQKNPTTERHAGLVDDSETDFGLDVAIQLSSLRPYSSYPNCL